MSVSPAGHLAYQVSPLAGESGRRAVWMNRNGEELGEVRAANLGPFFVLLPDEHRSSIRSNQRPGADIWTVDLSRGTSSRFTFGGGPARAPIWSANGRRVAFVRTTGVFEKDASGAGDERMLFPGPADSLTDWSPDGRHMLMTEGQRLLMVTLGSGSARVPVSAAGSASDMGRFSPDGRYIAYVSDESGRPEVSAAHASRRRQVAGLSRRGTTAQVAPRRQGVVLSDGDPHQFVVDVDTREGFTMGKPRVLLETPSIGDYAVSADAQRLLFSVPIEVGTNAPIVRRAELAPAVTAGREMTSARLLVFEDEQPA